ncbi:MAG TPA: hypothetical protein VGU73_04090 [Acidimicrobiia bacterium]|nr:hypothetical protein [Acidimicrobiia bacterium]
MDEPLHHVVGAEATIDYVAREPSPSPATGSAKVHEVEQQALLEAAFTGL